MVDRTPALGEVRRWLAEDRRAICHVRDEHSILVALDGSCRVHGDGWGPSRHELH